MHRAISVLGFAGLGLPEREAAKITGKVQIIHPYGSLGRLPWQTHEASIVEFGAKEGVDLPTVASGIRTYHEEIVDLTRQAVIEELFAAAETLVFLGFAYHDQNLALLRPKNPRENRRVFATAMGFEPADVSDIQGVLQTTFPYMKTAYVQPVTCAELFRNHQRVLQR